MTDVREMAGIVPTKRSSGRKQWTIHDGPRSSLKRLRSQLASDGCPESQVVLAKQLLDDNCEEDSERKENAILGVYWLIKASEQGNLEATHLLKTCLKTGKGITELNYMDVKSCISMTQDEKLARKAAREMFASLSNGGDFITSEQLQKKILSLDKEVGCSSSQQTENHLFGNGELVHNFEETSDSDTDDMDWLLRSDSCINEKLTEDHLISAAVDYSHGQLPIVNRILCLKDPNLKALDHIPFVHRSVLHPFLALRIIYYKFIKFLSQQSISMFLPIARTELQLLFLLLVYALYSSENVIYFFPMLAYYVTFLIMIISTCQMLQNTRNFFDFRLWSGLFICYSGGSINSEQAEYQYIRNNLKPYGHFFIALLGNLITYPIIVEQWIPQSELTIIAFCLIFMTLLGFMPKRRNKIVLDFLILFSFGVNVLAKYPYETDPVVTQGWRFLDLKVPTFITYIIGNGIEFCINFRLLLYACIPVVFIRIASKENWRGTYNCLIPHCVTLSWLQICIISSQGATMFGLLRGTLALVGIVLFLPLVGLTSILLPAIALTKWILTASAIYNVCLFIIFMTIGLGIAYLLAQTQYKQYTAVIQIFAAILCFFTLVNTFSKDEQQFYYNEKMAQSHNKYLNWEVFQRLCHQPVWQEENIAMAQIKCAELNNIPVHWNGYVNEIKIKSVTNNWRNVFDQFPRSIQEYLYCYYGEKIEFDCQNMSSGHAKSDCTTFYDSVKSINTCTLQKYNRYTFEILVKMDSGIWGKSPEVTLITEHQFKNFTLQLKPNDHIWFKGRLFNNELVGSNGVLGGIKPHINLEEIACLACHNNKLREYKLIKTSLIDVRTVVSSLYLSCKFILNLLLNPVVVFK